MFLGKIPLSPENLLSEASKVDPQFGEQGIRLGLYLALDFRLLAGSGRYGDALSTPNQKLHIPVVAKIARVFGSVRRKDGFWLRLRAAQLSAAANPTEGSPIAPRIIISDQAAVVRDSQHCSAVVHVHRFHRVC